MSTETDEHREAFRKYKKACSDVERLRVKRGELYSRLQNMDSDITMAVGKRERLYQTVKGIKEAAVS
jgi:hypothetical protein